MKTIVIHKRNMHSGDVYIGRPSKWGNPFILGRDGNRQQVIQKYEQYLLNNARLIQSVHELKGKRLACWCAPAPCHGDVLARYADAHPEVPHHD
jgi:hypothetical protein